MQGRPPLSLPKTLGQLLVGCVVTSGSIDDLVVMDVDQPVGQLLVVDLMTKRNDDSHVIREGRWEEKGSWKMGSFLQSQIW